MSSDSEQLCVVDSDTGQILYYFNPTTGEMKWVNQPPKELEVSKDCSSQQSDSRADNSFTPTDDAVKPSIDASPGNPPTVQTASGVVPKECSNFISGEVVTVLLEPSPKKNKDNGSAEQKRGKGAENSSDGSSISVFQCQHCDKVCSNKRQYVKHLRYHQKSFKHKCPCCPEKFNDPSSLALHVACHVKSKGFLCGQCNKCFTSDRQLAEHMVQHSGIKPFICHFCRSGFTHSLALSRHVILHLNEQSCRCNYCKKSFKGIRELSVHILTHMDSQKSQTRGVASDCEFSKNSFEGESSLKHNTEKFNQPRTPAKVPSINPLQQLQALIFKETPSFESRTRQNKPPPLLASNQVSVRAERSDVAMKDVAKCSQDGEGVVGPLKQLQQLAGGKASSTKKHQERQVAMVVNLSEVCNGVEAKPKHDSPMDGNPSPLPQGAHPADSNSTDGAGDLKILRCNKCDKIFSSSSELVRHFHHHMDVYQCTKCDKTFARECELKMHLIMHDSKPTLTCPKCDKTFIHSHGLNLHLRVHTGEKPFTCKHCGKAFAHSGNLTVHLRTHTGEKPYQCEYCHQAFNHSSNLKNHMRLHTGEKPYKCRACDRTFSRSSHLRNHVISHSLGKTETPMHRCEVCDKSFPELDLLTEHLKTHNDMRPHQCRFCGKAFTVPSGLAVHLRTHTGEKPYRCEYCSRAFSHSSNLKVHVRTHTGEKPYNCPTCKITFARSSDLRRHVYLQGCSQQNKNMGSPVVKQEQKYAGNNNEIKPRDGEAKGLDYLSRDQHATGPSGSQEAITRVDPVIDGLGREGEEHPLPLKKRRRDSVPVFSEDTTGRPTEGSALSKLRPEDNMKEGVSSSQQPPAFLLSTLALKPRAPQREESDLREMHKDQSTRPEVVSSSQGHPRPNFRKIALHKEDSPNARPIPYDSTSKTKASPPQLVSNSESLAAPYLTFPEATLHKKPKPEELGMYSSQTPPQRKPTHKDEAEQRRSSPQQPITHREPSPQQSMTHMEPSPQQSMTHRVPSPHQSMTHKELSPQQSMTHREPSPQHSMTHGQPSPQQPMKHREPIVGAPSTQEPSLHRDPKSHRVVPDPRTSNKEPTPQGESSQSVSSPQAPTFDSELIIETSSLQPLQALTESIHF
ncbi:zinc finger protein 91 [Nematostella vectensis]|uniref:zinc finger protein 91 n=1 Tax=Nematostella vectensis TaxID=45351 RepID=UPI002076E6EC|nr:zinc finger protein 91 [Nematostella vectensis]